MNKDNVIEQIAKTYSSFEDCYKLITDTCKFCLDSDGVWKRLELKWMLEFFQSKEDYEKCITLKKLIDESFIGDETKQNELNSKLDKYVSQLTYK